MWKKRCFYFCVLIVCSINLFALRVSSASISSNSLSDEEKDSFLDRICWELIDTDSHKSPICCFDVAEDGTIALAIASNAIFVYDEHGVFQYGCSFRADGDFVIEFDEDKLILHFLRGNTMLFVDDSGACVDIQKAVDPVQHVILINEIRNQTAKAIDEKTYSLERDLNIGDFYSRFIIDENGKRMVLYDVTSDHIVKQIMLVASPICFFAFIFYGLAKNKSKKNN